MKNWNDDLLVKSLAGKLGCDFIKEDEDVVEARLAFLEKNKRYVYTVACSLITETEKQSLRVTILN